MPWTWLLLLLVLGCTPAPAATRQGLASWYGVEACRFNRDPACPTASGQSLYTLIAQGIPYAASNAYPLGTKLNVCAGDQCEEVVCLDRGPHPRLHRLIEKPGRGCSKL